MRSIEDRFWEKVLKAGAGDCWEWTAAKKGIGYGQIARGRKGAGPITAHRLSYEIHHGPVPNGRFVCHTCDNPGCVNPAHLYAGSPADNMRDRKQRGRATGGRPVGSVPSGGNSPTAKITEQDARKIIEWQGSVREIAKIFGISESQARRIRSGKQWGHLHVEAGTS